MIDYVLHCRYTDVPPILRDVRIFQALGLLVLFCINQFAKSAIIDNCGKSSKYFKYRKNQGILQFLELELLSLQ